MSKQLLTVGGDHLPQVAPTPETEARFAQFLTPVQVDGVRRMVANLADPERGRFLLDDGPGVGKTMQILATACHLHGTTGKPSLVSVPTKLLASQVMDDAKEAGIKADQVVVTTHDKIEKRLAATDYAGLFVDEAHKLADANGALPAWKIPSVYATGSSFDSPELAVEFTSWLRGTSRVNARAILKLTFDDLSGTARPSLGSSWRDVIQSIHGVQLENFRNGLAVRREVPFVGSAAIHEAPGVRGSLMSLGTAVAKAALADIASNRKVVIYCFKRASNAIEQALRDAGIKCADADDVDRFTKGPRNAILLHIDGSAEGIRLHDKTGNSPRSILLCELCDVATLLQIQGRISRRKTMSDCRMTAIVDPECEKDRMRLQVLNAQCNFLRGTLRAVPALAGPIEEIISERTAAMSVSSRRR